MYLDLFSLSLSLSKLNKIIYINYLVKYLFVVAVLIRLDPSNMISNSFNIK